MHTAHTRVAVPIAESVYVLDPAKCLCCSVAGLAAALLPLSTVACPHFRAFVTGLTGFPVAEHAGLGCWLEPHCSCCYKLVVCKRKLQIQRVCVARQ